MKVVINVMHGRFGLSEAAIAWLAEKAGGVAPTLHDIHEMARDDHLLVECVETLGRAANDKLADLAVVEIPDGTDYIVQEYDGAEWVAEKHRTWP